MICTLRQIFELSYQEEYDRRGIWYYRGKEQYIRRVLVNKPEGTRTLKA